MKRYSWIRWLAATALAIALLAMWTPQFTDAEIENDARESMGMAVNLARHGVMSMDDSPPYRPTNFREPVPVIVSAIGIKVLDRVLGPAGPKTRFDFDRPFEIPSDALHERLPHNYLEAPRIKYLKYQNYLWLGLLSFGAFWAALVLPFAWRGAAQTLPFLLVGLLLGLGLRRYDVTLFLLPAFGIVLVYALFTPCFPRFGWPPHLIAILAFLIVIKLLWDAFAARGARAPESAMATEPGR